MPQAEGHKWAAEHKMPKRKHAGRSPGGADHPEEGMVVLHRSSFIDWKPSPIVSLASSGDGSLSVALRENGDLELYESSSLMQFQVCINVFYWLK